MGVYSLLRVMMKCRIHLLDQHLRYYITKKKSCLISSILPLALLNRSNRALVQVEYLIKQLGDCDRSAEDFTLNGID